MTVGAWYRARLRERDKEIDRLRAQNLALRAQLLPDTNEGVLTMNYANTDMPTIRRNAAKALFDATAHLNGLDGLQWSTLPSYTQDIYYRMADAALEAAIPSLAHKIVKSTNMRWQHDGTPTVVGPVTQGHAESVLRA